MVQPATSIAPHRFMVARTLLGNRAARYDSALRRTLNHAA